MKKIIIVGPLPPPIHGESLAIQSIIKSKEINLRFNLTSVNTNRVNVKEAGKFAFIKIFEDFKHILKVAQLTLLKKVDVLYISISQTKLGLIRDLIMIYLASIRSKKIITHLHGNNLGNVIDSFNKFEIKIVKWILKKVNVGIVLGEALKGNYRGYVSDVRVVYNGVDSNYFSEEEIDFKYSDQSKKNEINILYLSNLIESKGYKELIESIISLLKEGVNVNLFLAGQVFDQDEFNFIWEKVEGLSLTNKIKFLGTVIGNEKKDLLRNSDVFVLPTNYHIEGQPLSIIEAMSAANAIISTKRGSISDLIDNNGILLESGEKVLIKKAIIDLINNPVQMLEMKKHSRERFLKDFTLDKYLRSLTKIFEEE